MTTNSPVSDDHHLEHLDDLVTEERHTLEVAPGAHLTEGTEEDGVVGMGQLDSRKQVRDDPVEEGDIMGKELRQVHIYDGAQQL